LRPSLDAEIYRERVGRAVEWIRAGETYQINLSQPFSAEWTQQPEPAELAAAAVMAYADLRARAPATMGAILGVRPGSWLLSNSPETLLTTRRDQMGRWVARSHPIKGTRPRGGTESQDRELAQALLDSEKDRAEHVMIVDLVRSDLGRVCVPGSVRVPVRDRLVTLPTVHHLVSEVEGVLRDGTSLQTLVRALWPGGSITGAPKRRTLELIEDLERELRGIYCGAIFVLHAGGIDASIPIRTALVDHEGLRLRSGGGIVVDSDPESERLETIDKARAFAAPV
jgi:anthranilate/para-aminobenzoate synthase component I